MKKTRIEKGITLIALIITIIILLILAVVTIGSIKNSNIITYAQNAASDYGTGKDKEEGIIWRYEDLIESNLPGGNAGSWTDNGDGTFTSSDGPTVTIGDYIDYNEGSFKHTPDVEKGAGTKYIDSTLTTEELKTEDLKWRVLGVNEKGQLELISSTKTTQSLYLKGNKGFIYAEDNLNNFCNDLYGKGIYAVGGRSLDMNDINKLTKYDPTKYEGYGDKWIYRYPSIDEMETNPQYIQSSGDDGKTWYTTNITSFYVANDNITLNYQNVGHKELINSYYSYDIENDEIKDFLSSKGLNYFLATTFTWCSNDNAKYGIHCMAGDIGMTIIYDSNKVSLLSPSKIRPVVTLSSNVSVVTNENENSETNMWTLK